MKCIEIWGLGIGDWGLGIGDWGLGPIPNPQSPIPIQYISYKIIILFNFLVKFMNNFKFLIFISDGRKSE